MNLASRRHRRARSRHASRCRIRSIPPAAPRARRSCVASFSVGAEFLEHYSGRRRPPASWRWSRARRPRGARRAGASRSPGRGLPNPVFVRATRVAPPARAGRAAAPDETRGARLPACTWRAATRCTCHLRRHRRYCVRLPLSWRPFGGMRDGRRRHRRRPLDRGACSSPRAQQAPPVGRAGGPARPGGTPRGRIFVVTGVVRHAGPRTARATARSACSSSIARPASSDGCGGLLRAFAARGVVILDAADR